MSTVKKGVLTKSGEWAKHLRTWGKRLFWKKHRRIEQTTTKKEIKRDEG